MTEHTLPTKERILISAGDIFGKRGFSDTTIRSIARQAKVNIAAVNYHFGDKEGLYRAVLEDVFSRGFARFPATLGIGEDADPQVRLRYFIKGMFYRLQSPEGWGGMAGQGRLISREMLDPSPAFETILEKYIKPHKDLLVSIIAEIMQETDNTTVLLACAVSILGQCVYYSMASSVIDIVSDGSPPMDRDLDRLAEFVYHFSLGGIANIKKESSIQRKE